jgi:hypothetical protein
MMPTPWERGYKPKPLNRELYSLPQVFAAEGKLPRDHAAWQLTERDEGKYWNKLEEAAFEPLPEFAPADTRWTG